jgi:zinc protease
MVFQGFWPYEHTAIGTMADLDAAQLDWVKQFHDTYYAPNNAVLSIAGDFEPDEAMALVTKFFGDAKPQPNIPKYDPGPVPQQTAPRDAIVEDVHAQLPAILMGWQIPQSRTKEHYAVELAANILADGESSRLHRVLVREKSLAIGVSVETDDYRGPGDYVEAMIKLAKGVKPADAQHAFDAELASLAGTGPTDAEMTKVHNRLQASFIFGLQSNYMRAQKLAEFELYWGDAQLLLGELDRYMAITKDDIKKAVATYMTLNRRSRVDVKPVEEKKEEKKPDGKKPDEKKPATPKDGAKK